jgi:hypothetical protein
MLLQIASRQLTDISNMSVFQKIWTVSNSLEADRGSLLIGYDVMQL